MKARTRKAGRPASRTASPKPRPSTKLGDFPFEPGPVDATRALCLLGPAARKITADADVWRVSCELQWHLYPDYMKVWSEHHAVTNAITDHLGSAFAARLEHVDWALQHRERQAAYLLGVAVGQSLRLPPRRLAEHLLRLGAGSRGALDRLDG